MGTYQTLGERLRFLRLRGTGAVSFFRCGYCAACGREIPQGVDFCGLYCSEFLEMSELFWKGLEDLIGKRIQVETKDGGYRHGVLTSIQWAEVNVDGRALRTPAGIGLDNEPGDRFVWDQLKMITDAG